MKIRNGVLGRRLAVTLSLATAAATVPLTVGAAEFVNSGYNYAPCPSGKMCVSDRNVSGYVNPYTMAYSGENVYSFTPATYHNGTAVEDRANSTRNRDGGVIYSHACFYTNFGYSGGKVSVSYTEPGWYDNSTTDLSSARFRNGC